ncbi:MAG: hypothetical protein INR73_00195 [Williamsia sp.]|nr:hypothetical protein [Williamsia sp.]
MVKYKNIFSSLVALMLSAASFAQTNKAATEYLGIPGPVKFDNKVYSLSWTSHPAANFYKQEYLVKGDDANRFHSMILVDVITGEKSVKNVVAVKLAELKKMKEGNQVVNYEVMDNSAAGEYMIDFLLTANAPDGSVSIVERNVYRYKAFADKSGHAGVLLFGVSTRGYGPDVTSFIASLKSNKRDLTGKVAGVAIPAVVIRE